jgi:chitinase
MAHFALLNARRLSLLSVFATLAAACSAQSSDENSATGVAHLSASDCAASADWAENVAYATGANVKYAGKVYRCVQGHTSLSSWTPDAVPALWEPTDCAPSSGNSGGGNTGGGNTGGGNTGGGSDGCVAWVYMADANSCVGHLGSSCGWTTDNEGQGYHCANMGTWVGCEPGGMACTPGSGNTGGGNSGGGNNGGGTTGGGSTGGTTGGNGGHPTGALPKHVLTGYWQNFNNGAKVLRLSDVPASYGLIAVAFADTDPGSPGAITFNLDSGLSGALGGYSASQFSADIAALHGQGRKVILSVGGQNGTISVSDATTAANFANSVYAQMQKYGFDGVDIDLENGINASAMGSALHQLASKAGSGLIITLAPQTIDMQSTQGGYFQLALGIKDILTIVNMQFYNSGSMLGADGKVYSQGSVDFLTALAAIQLQGGLRPDQVGIGLPASPSGAGSGFVSPSIVNAALDCLGSGTNCGSFKPSTTYPGIRGAMDWSINWDASSGYSFANTVAPHFSAVP